MAKLGLLFADRVDEHPLVEDVDLARPGLDPLVAALGVGHARLVVLLAPRMAERKITTYYPSFASRGAVAQSVERPSKVPQWCNSADVIEISMPDVGSNPAAAICGQNRNNKCEDLEKKHNLLVGWQRVGTRVEHMLGNQEVGVQVPWVMLFFFSHFSFLSLRNLYLKAHSRRYNTTDFHKRCIVWRNQLKCAQNWQQKYFVF